MKIFAAILCAGRGTRFGSDKLAAVVGGIPVWKRSYLAYARHPQISGVILVGREDNEAELKSVESIAVVRGGERRQDSTFAALSACPPDADVLLVHDGARPFVDEDTISRVIAATTEVGAAAAANPVTDSVKFLSSEAIQNLDRARLRAVQTPQGVQTDLLRRAAEISGDYTDELSMVEALGERFVLVDGHPGNFKITDPDDLVRARARFGGTQTRTGFGYDVHRFSTDPDRPLWLGGVHFPGEVGLEGHSDADVVLHAVTDALLGARADGDIGQHFSNTDPRWKNRPSIDFLRFAADRTCSAGYAITHLDIAVVAERPKIMPRASEIRQTIATAAGIELHQVSIKATTKEGLDDIGAKLGIEAWCVATIREA